jgi:hypothetical protein
VRWNWQFRRSASCCWWPVRVGISEKFPQIFDIVLADDYETSKCQWRDEENYDTTILEPLGQRYEPGRAPPGDTGGGTSTQRYKAARSGIVHVTLDQQDNANPPHVARRIALDVTVR